jgi:ABC-2 type transport system permease protein/lipopolysaccharide transport system permease protein
MKTEKSSIPSNLSGNLPGTDTLKVSTFYDSNENSFQLYDSVKYLFNNRELLIVLVARDLKSRYRRSFLGILWTLINPILSSLILWIVFVSMFKSRLSNGTQYAPYLIAGVLTITFFNQGLMQAAEALSNGSALFLKIRVRPIIFPLASSLSNTANFFFGIVALILVSWISKTPISMTFPLFLLVGLSLLLLTTGLGLIFGILFIRFDDSKYILSIFLQLLTYLTPIFYPKEALGNSVRFAVSLNPLTSYLDVFRHVFNGTEIATGFDWFYMFASALFIFILGLYTLKRNWSQTVVMM